MTNNVKHNQLLGTELHNARIDLVSGAPAAAPQFSGQTAWDYANHRFYIALGTSSSSDWDVSSIVSINTINGGNGLSINSTTQVLSLSQDIRATASPAFVGMTLSAFGTGIVHSSSLGVLSSSLLIDANVDANAGIEFSKLQSLPSAYILVGSSVNVPTPFPVSGELTLTSSGNLTINPGVIFDSKVNAAAAIAGTKIVPNFGSQNIQTTGTLTISGGSTLTGGLTFDTGTGSSLILNGTNTALTVVNNVSIGGSIGVTGNSTLTGTLVVQGIGTGLTVSHDASISGQLSVTSGILTDTINTLSVSDALNIGSTGAVILNLGTSSATTAVNFATGAQAKTIIIGHAADTLLLNGAATTSSSLTIGSSLLADTIDAKVLGDTLSIGGINATSVNIGITPTLSSASLFTGAAAKVMILGASAADTLTVHANTTFRDNVTLGNASSSAHTVRGSLSVSNGLSVAGGFTSDSQTTTGLTVNGNIGITGNILLADSSNIDTTTAGTSDTLNIGSARAGIVNLATSPTAQVVNIGTGASANTINIGGSTSTVAIKGTLTYNNVTNLQVDSKEIIVNHNGLAGSAASAGLLVNEGGINTGYFITDGSTRTAWQLKAPASAGVVNIIPGTVGFTLNQGVALTDSPTFSGLSLTNFTGVLKASSGTVSSSTILDADVSATAAVLGTKIVPNFGTQNISTTGSASVGNISFSGGMVVSISSIKTANYSVLFSDYLVRLNSTGASFTVTLTASPVVGTLVRLKGIAGALSVNPVTVQAASGGVLIDGASSFIMNADYESADFVFDGTNWMIL